MTYDFLIVGAGLTGAICAYELSKKNYSVLVIDKRNHIGGNCYTERRLKNIDVHLYGAHIFHTDNKEVWDYINQFDNFLPFKNIVKAEYNDKEYTLPFNLTTLNEVYGHKIKQPTKQGDYSNIEEYAINELGEKLYRILIQGYTEKQWGLPCKDLPIEIIKRIPIRENYDDNYYDVKYQGIPQNGYTHIFKQLLQNIPLRLNTSFNQIKNKVSYKKLIYTGIIDEYYDYCFGKLPYRSLDFAHIIKKGTYQTNAVRNYTSINIPYTRTIEHKHFLNCKNDKTIISFEFPSDYDSSNEPYYPINTKQNNTLYSKYASLPNKEVYFLGRLGQYKYMNMSDTISNALNFCKKF